MATKNTNAIAKKAASTPAPTVLTAKQLKAQEAKSAKFFAEQEALKLTTQLAPVVLQHPVIVPTSPFAALEQPTAPVVAKPVPAVKVPQVVQNGVKLWKVGTIGRQLWDLYAAFPGGNPSKKEAEELALANGLNATSSQISLYTYRKFHGLTGTKAQKQVQVQGQDDGLVALKK